MTQCLRAIEALWYELGTAADAAAAANLHRNDDCKLSPESVREIWRKATAEGRLPPFIRPQNGYLPNQSTILKRFMMIGMEKAA